MRVCVFGAGAIGGYLAVGLAEAGHDTSVVARGAHLQAIQGSGLRLLTVDGGERHAAVRATDDPVVLGTQDLVICALKAHQSWESAERFAPLLDPRTAVITAMNGFPWCPAMAGNRTGAGHRVRRRASLRGHRAGHDPA